MSESSQGVLASCFTIAIVIGSFVFILFIIGAGVLLFGSKLSGL
jgi:hypothetical protein